VSKHTPTPWGDNDNGIILGNLDNYEFEAPIVCVVGSDSDYADETSEAWKQRRADTDHIVLCVNAHDELVAALKELVHPMADRYYWTEKGREILAKLEGGAK
jgi:hypothetical protein